MNNKPMDLSQIYPRIYEAVVRDFPGVAILVFDPGQVYVLAGGELLKKWGLEDIEGKQAGETLPNVYRDMGPMFAATLAGQAGELERRLGGAMYRFRFSPVEIEGQVVAGLITALEVHPHMAALRRSNEALKRYAYIASHDLQEPLRAIGGFARLLSERYVDQLDEQARQYFGFITDGAQRLQAMINALLVYSQVSTQAARFQLIETETALDEALANLEMTIVESGTVVNRDPLPRLRGDLDQLTRIFQNLIGNAIKYRGTELPLVYVSARPGDPNREREAGMWLFSVADNGDGIEAEQQKRIFDLFARGQQGKPGVGVGLAICKFAVEQHGGSIWVESEPGWGSTFYFTIPESAIPEDRVPESAGPESARPENVETDSYDASKPAD